MSSMVTRLLKNVINDRPYDPKDYITPPEEGVDLVPNSIELSGLEVQLVSALSRKTLQIKKDISSLFKSLKKYNSFVFNRQKKYNMR